MGYSSSVTGDITFTRPASSQEQAATEEAIARAKEAVEQLGGQVSFPEKTVLSERTLATLQGSGEFHTLNYFFAINHDGITSVGEEDKAYDLVQELRKMISLVREDGAFANGTIDVQGSDRGDIWRVVIKDNDLREEHATVTLAWPDGTSRKL
jgi:hypothetical protein